VNLYDTPTEGRKENGILFKAGCERSKKKKREYDRHLSLKKGSGTFRTIPSCSKAKEGASGRNTSERKRGQKGFRRAWRKKPEQKKPCPILGKSLLLAPAGHLVWCVPTMRSGAAFRRRRAGKVGNKKKGSRAEG